MKDAKDGFLAAIESQMGINELHTSICALRMKSRSNAISSAVA